MKSEVSKTRPHFQEQNTVALDDNPAYNDGSINNYHQHEPIEPYYSLVTEAEGVAAGDARDSYVEVQQNCNT